MVWYRKIGVDLIKNHDILFYEKCINKIVQVLHKDVCYKFRMVVGVEIPIYEYSKIVDSFITINIKDSILLSEYSSLLSQLLNYSLGTIIRKVQFYS